jgi:hypothetical protein
MHSEGPVTGHIGTAFLDINLLRNKMPLACRLQRVKQYYGKISVIINTVLVGS